MELYEINKSPQIENLRQILARAVFDGYVGSEEADEIFDYAINLMAAKGGFALSKIERAFDIKLS